ncbi:hypothetical protein EGW08_001859 [Elysia chlorotica]|uniref:Uncharacterized protein n=1 Tax=Elysia chlorotica TaxID=188477 RepID=A0A3S1BKJ4_ELYCH|nr:hypothetical protein EGW08_001859 [Elysia chlorotica]
MFVIEYSSPSVETVNQKIITQCSRPRVLIFFLGYHPQIDTKFDQAEDILYRVASLQRYQEDSRSKFCGQVVAAGLVAESQDGSLQNCLVALRDRLEGLDLKLQLKLSDEFCHLEVKASTEDAELDKDIRYAIKTFNKEYAAVTRAILSEFPVAELKLSQIESEVDGLCAPHQEVQDPTGHGRAAANHSSVSHISNAGNNASGVRQTAEARAGVAAGCAGGAVERNRAVLRHVARECHDCLAHVQRTVKQAKAAFVW